MTHPEMDEVYELFVLGTLESDYASQIEEHLRDGCAHCEARVRDAKTLMAAFAETLEITPAPAHLRQRVLSSVRRVPTPKRANRMASDLIPLWPRS